MQVLIQTVITLFAIWGGVIVAAAALYLIFRVISVAVMKSIEEYEKRRKKHEHTDS